MSRVLIVDDNADNRYLLQAVLTASKHEVCTACDGIEALARARSVRPDLVVSDILMPRMDGFALCREWRADEGLRSIPFMFYTATYTEPKDEAFALALGADRFVIKPQEPAVLAGIVEEMLAAGQGVDASGAWQAEGPGDPDSELSFLREHRDAVIRKLEDKMVQLEAANSALRRDVAERRRVEAGLRESEARFQLLAEVSPVGIFQTDSQGATTYVNRRWADIAGFSAEEALGDGWLRAVHPDDRQRLAAGWGQMSRDGLDSKAEYRFLRQDATVVWVIGQAAAVRDESGKVIGYVGTITDITERIHAERALRESEERYRSLFDQSPIGLYRTTPDGSILLANPMLVAILGYGSVEELKGVNLEVTGFGADSPRPRFKTMLARDGLVRNFESRWARKDGSFLVVRETAHAVRGEDGSVRYYEGAVEDITERARAAEAQRRLAAAVEQAAEAVVMTDSEGTIQYVNPAFARITGYTQEEVLGQNPRILKSGKRDASFYQDMWTALLEKRTWSGHLINRRKDGSLYEEEATISAVLDDAGAVSNYVAVKRDVTTELALQQQLNQAQKMEAIGRLAGGIAHDFNNLLQAILSQLAVLELRLRAAPGSQKPIAEVGQLVRRGAALTRQLLLFSRRGAAVRERADLNLVVEGAAGLLRRVVRENVAITTELGGGALPLLADPGQLDQVLMNLAVNASDAMPEGGSLTLRTSGDASQVRLTVTDTGEGMPGEVLAHMFEPFFTTKAIGKGTGLGLSVVHGIVTSHGGTVEVTSEPGSGTTFMIKLPRHVAAESPATPTSTEAGDLPMGRGERILVVEDEDGARQGLLEVLGTLGYAVTAAASGEEAGALPERPAYDLLLTDFLLPGITGADLATGLRDRWPRLKVVVMSGYAEDDTLHRLGAGSAVTFLQKPFGMQALARVVRHTLDGEAAPHLP